MHIPGTVDSILNHKSATVWHVAPTTMVFDAIELMSKHNIGALPVMEGDRLIGVFSERDYTRKVVLKGKTSKTTMVREIISTPVVTVVPDATVEECMRLMTDKRIRHLPVVEDKSLVGIISIGDVVNWIISAQHSALEQMEHYISGTYPG
jgi:CBS domain-containing protein